MSEQEFDIELFNLARATDAFALTEAVLECSQLSSTAKLCLLWLFKYGRKPNPVFPSQAGLAKNLGISLSQTQNILKELRDEGFIIIISPTPKERLYEQSATYEFIYHQIFKDICPMKKGIKDPKKFAELEKRASQKVNRKKKVAAPPPVVEKKVEKPIDRDEHGWGLPDVKPTYSDPFNGY